MNTREFFETYFESKPEDHYIVIFTLPNQLPCFFKHIDNALAHIERQREVQNQHLYFCTNFLFQKPAKGRGTAADSGGVCCFYMDVDIDSSSPAHVKSDYPKSEAEAIELVKSIGFDPSIIVHSGYGLHVYWLFKEPWLFESNEDRERYHNLLLRVQATVKAKAETKGWRLDSTGDLARILRVPGSFNWKIPDKPAEVRVIEHKSELRYNPEYIEPYLVDETHIRKTALPDTIKTQVLNEITLNRDANPPVEKLEALCEIEEQFSKSWKAKRVEFGDDPSRYAQSLANYAARAGWTRQEMCDLIIAFYRRHLDNPLFTHRPGKEPISMERIMRPIKITHTIGKAIQAAEAERVESEEDEPRENECAPESTEAPPTPGECSQPTASTPKPSEAKVAQALQMISVHLQINVRELTRYIAEEGATNAYEMLVEKDGTIHRILFGSVKELHQQAHFDLRITDELNIVPKSVEKDVWGRIRRAFTDITANRFVYEECSTIEGKLRVWLREYLENKPPLTPAQGKRNGQPFVEKGHWYIYARTYTDWCKQFKSKDDEQARATIHLDRAGITGETVWFPCPGKPGQRDSTKAFRIPRSFVIPPARPELVVDNTITEDEADERVLEDAVEPS